MKGADLERMWTCSVVKTFLCSPERKSLVKFSGSHQITCDSRKENLRGYTCTDGTLLLSTCALIS